MKNHRLPTSIALLGGFLPLTAISGNLDTASEDDLKRTIVVHEQYLNFFYAQSPRTRKEMESQTRTNIELLTQARAELDRRSKLQRRDSDADPEEYEQALKNGKASAQALAALQKEMEEASKKAAIKERERLNEEKRKKQEKELKRQQQRAKASEMPDEGFLDVAKNREDGLIKTATNAANGAVAILRLDRKGMVKAANNIVEDVAPDGLKKEAKTVISATDKAIDNAQNNGFLKKLRKTLLGI